MRKIFVVTFLLVMFTVAPVYAAENWQNYESGRNNIRLEGYNGQPGYIAFEDGDGNVTGYLWMSDNGQLVFVSASAWDDTTQKLGVDFDGLALDVDWSGGYTYEP